jgi:cbb3-type cytochrome oxidase subunit 3
MLRLILLFFLFFLFFIALNLYLFSRKKPRHLRQNDAAKPEEMVLDPQCQSYLPKSEAMLRGDQYFCSEQCARLYLAARSS